MKRIEAVIERSRQKKLTQHGTKDDEQKRSLKAEKERQNGNGSYTVADRERVFFPATRQAGGGSRKSCWNGT
jgi:hypothetical protein